MLYFIPADASSPPIKLPSLQMRARRAGDSLLKDKWGGSYSLLDRRLRLPILEHRQLNEIVMALELTRKFRRAH